MVHIVHIASAPQGAIFIGRPSIYGNPIVLRAEADRAGVLQQYRRYLRGSLSIRGELYNALEALVQRAREEDIYLACFCAPKPCHGDILKAYIDYRLQSEQTCYNTNLPLTHISILRDRSTN